jgi:ABC-type transport system involved in multi-copper enzyme maturation permease subunit
MNPVRTSPDAYLTYRAWRGRLGGPWRGALAVTRLGLAGLARRKLLWVLYACCVLIFLSFFFGQYLLVWAGAQVGEQEVRGIGFQRVNPQDLVKNLRDSLKLNGSAETFRNLFAWEGSILIVTLALVGAQLVGNDFRYRSLPFYLAKPLSGRHYVFGKCLAVAVVVLAMTALPAVLLFVEYGLLEGWEYFWDARRLLAGILGYGALLAVVLSLLLVAVTSWVQKTVPLVMVWSAIFIMAPLVGLNLAEWTGEPQWRLMDLWNCGYIVGNRMLGVTLEKQPSVAAAATMLAVAVFASIGLLSARIRAVEVV